VGLISITSFPQPQGTATFINAFADAPYPEGEAADPNDSDLGVEKIGIIQG
jgi:hypothetical protein